MRIRVTQVHIDAGEVNCMKCPIALAIDPLLREDVIVMVDSKEITIRSIENHDYCDLKTPSDVGRLIVDFDGGSSIEPFQFELDIPEVFLC